MYQTNSATYLERRCQDSPPEETSVLRCHWGKFCLGIPSFCPHVPVGGPRKVYTLEWFAIMAPRRRALSPSWTDCIWPAALRSSRIMLAICWQKLTGEWTRINKTALLPLFELGSRLFEFEHVHRVILTGPNFPPVVADSHAEVVRCRKNFVSEVWYANDSKDREFKQRTGPNILYANVEFRLVGRDLLISPAPIELMVGTGLYLPAYIKYQYKCMLHGNKIPEFW